MPAHEVAGFETCFATELLRMLLVNGADDAPLTGAGKRLYCPESNHESRRQLPYRSKESFVKYSIVIPVYNSGAWLPELVERVGRVMDRIGQPFELILINDASPDVVTWPAIEKVAARHPWVRGVDLFFNTGQFRATLCGLSEARGEFVVTMDDDLQHPPEEIPKLIEAIEKEPRTDCVFGRYEQKKHSGFRNVGTRLMSSLLWLLYEKPTGLEITSFRVMSRKLVDGILSCRTAHPQLGPMILRLTKNASNVKVCHEQRSFGRSGYQIGKLLAETLRSVINASTFSLRLVSLLGMVLSGSS